MNCLCNVEHDECEDINCKCVHEDYCHFCGVYLSKEEKIEASPSYNVCSECEETQREYS